MLYVSKTRSYGERALHRAEPALLLAGTVTEPQELSSVMGITEEVWSELATGSQSVATQWLPYFHSHIRTPGTLIDRALCQFKNHHRDISVVSRAEHYQLPATLDNVTDRSYVPCYRRPDVDNLN